MTTSIRLYTGWSYTFAPVRIPRATSLNDPRCRIYSGSRELMNVKLRSIMKMAIVSDKDLEVLNIPGSSPPFRYPHDRAKLERNRRV